MKFGMSTWFFQEFSVAEALRKIKAAGYESAEIWMEHILKTEENYPDIRNEAGKLGLSLTVHATSYDINITSINKGIREESEKQAYDAISAGSQLGAEIVVIHPGRLSASRSSAVECKKKLFRVFEKIDKWASEKRINVGIEAMEKRSREIYIYPEDVIEFMSSEWKRIFLTFDIAHAYTVMEPSEYLDKINPEWIGHVHLSDGNRESTHLPLGEGRINLIDTLKNIKKFYSSNVIIEGYVPGKGLETAENNYKYLLKNNLI